MSARDYGTGNIGVDKRGLHYGRVELPPHPDGRRNRKRVTAKTKPEMLRKLRALQEKVDRGETIRGRGYTVRSWGEHYLAHLAPEKSRTTYGEVLRNWCWPHLPSKGNAALDRLQPEHVDKMLAALKSRGMSNGTRAKARTVLSATLTAAEQRHHVQRNVARLSKAPKTKSRVSDALTVEQVEAVLEYVHTCVELDDGTRAPDRLWALAVLALMLGMRQAECLDLTWDRVDLKRRSLVVYDAKTPSGERSIPLPDPAVEALTAHRKAQRAERMAADVWANPELVFATTVGTRIDRRNCLRWWHGITKAVKGVGRHRFHATRHTCATVMLNNGVDLEIVTAILGHGSTAITAKIYAAVGAEKLREGSAAMNRLFATGSDT